jgi:DNA-binding response OmpR family regulator
MRDASERLSVLVVEDSWIIAQHLADRLDGWGYAVLGPTRSVAEATRLIAGEEPDLALLDVSLGTETSFPIADMLSALGVAFAFVTAYQDSDLPERFAGCPIVRKPVVDRLLEAAVRDLAASEAGARGDRTAMASEAHKQHVEGARDLVAPLGQ